MWTVDVLTYPSRRFLQRTWFSSWLNDDQCSSKEKIDATLFDYVLFDYTAYNGFFLFFFNISAIVRENWFEFLFVVFYASAFYVLLHFLISLAWVTWINLVLINGKGLDKTYVLKHKVEFKGNLEGKRNTTERKYLWRGSARKMNRSSETLQTRADNSL